MRSKYAVTVAVVLLMTVVVVASTQAGVKQVFPADNAQRVFNYTPIEVEFTERPEDVQLTIVPNVKGATKWENNELIFVPEEAYKSETYYEVTVSWGEDSYRFGFTTIQEVRQIWYDDFTTYPIWMFPMDNWTSFLPEDRADFAVVDFDQSPHGRALRGLDGGKDNAHALLPSFELEDAENSVLVEVNLWVSKTEFTGIYLWDGKPTFPPYANVGNLGRYYATDEMAPYTLTVVFDLKSHTADVYVNYRPLMKGVAFRTVPEAGHKFYAVGLYFNNTSSDVYWTDIRVAEIVY